MSFRLENTYRVEITDGLAPLKPLVVVAPSFGKAAGLAYSLMATWENASHCDISSIHYVGQTLI